MTIKSTAIKATLFVVLVAALSLPALAQTGSSVLTWDLQLPAGDSKDFLGRGTLTARGVGFQIRRQMQENIWAGAYLGWHVMNGSTEGTFEFSPEGTEYMGHGTGKYWSYINVFPVMANVFYQTGAPRGLQVTAGLNAGGYIYEEHVEVSTVAFEQSRWLFGFAPEIGIKYPVSYEASAYLAVKYHFGFKNSKTISGDSTGLSYLPISIGVAFDHGFF